MASQQEAVLLEAVEQLQAGLFWLPHPKNVLKYMKRLNDLPMSMDILVETGIGRTVNSLCKYEEVGAMARNIVGRWRNLVSDDGEFDSDSDLDLRLAESDFESSHSRKRPHNVWSKEDDFQKTWKSSSSQPWSPNLREKKHLKLSELETDLRDGERREERQKDHQILPLDRLDSGQVQSQSSTSLQQTNASYSSLHEGRDQKSGKSPGLHIQDNIKDKIKSTQKSQLGVPSQVTPWSFKANGECQLLYQKENYQLDFQGQRKNFPLSKEKLPNVAFRGMCQSPPWGTDIREKQNSATMRDSKDNCNVKDYSSPLDLSFVRPVTKTKQQDPPTSKLEKSQLSQDLYGGKWLKDKEVSNNVETQEEKYKAPNSQKSECFLPESVRPESNAKDEHPITSYGSNFNYAWQPQSQKNITIPIVVQENQGHIKENSAKTDCKGPDSVENLQETYNVNPEKQQSEAMLDKLKNTSTPATSCLGGIALHTGQASCQNPSLETRFPLKPKKKIATPYHEEEGFTGQRLNSKMKVYSGPKYVFQPKLLSLYQQCIRVLNRNLDSIHDIGSIPYTVLEPVLEKCTPKQLQRIEEYNHILVKDTNKLWKIHCNRDFGREMPKPSESWRELYHRLKEAREKRMLLLRENIRLYYSKRPSVPQTMASVNSTAKPPQGIRKRQEKNGTDRATILEMINNKAVQYPPSIPYSNSCGYSSSDTSASNIPSTSSTNSTNSCDARKTSGKKIAPMMAKTIKAFKNRYNR
ncbi:elongin-A-like [Macrotis lagotis]|uniref:elongin-A-like n=1 Tax=Macrotis lagotis TaxID=92651 RepID=UPI003D688D59